ncbi:hypothetical protein Golomagni_06567, partial [Golovinomyces magnicellulatus]
CIGPVIGGFVTQDVGWRWTFWIVLIMASVVSITALIFMRETYEPVLRKRMVTAKGDSQESKNTPDQEVNVLRPGQLLFRAFVRPTKLLIFSPIVLLLSLYSAFVFGLIYLLFTTFPLVFEKTYGFGPGISGLSYLGLGLGMVVGIVLFSKLSDKLMNRTGGGSERRPELRLLLMIWAAPVIPIGCFWYGWSAHAVTHWIVPILGTFFIGLGAFLLMMPAQIYLVDSFGSDAAASALAANTVLRSLAGTFLPFAGDPLYSKLGLGWGNSLLGFLAIAFAPVPIFFYKYGERLRTKFKVDY